MKEKQVIFTGSIPQCPYCEKPTTRSGGSGSVTAMYFEPRYDENGVNVNPDRNTITSSWHCQGCNGGYATHGNNADGFTYKNIPE